MVVGMLEWWLCSHLLPAGLLHGLPGVQPVALLPPATAQAVLCAPVVIGRVTSQSLMGGPM